ncbi:MAG: DUF4430 domain-containing protein [Firmicutes bacterium]|nr:DUF4430 domain-containing protein [Bacillota bacterium]MBQ4092702.1 DUF4430 domain-containing protein [Bacillota bacterium]
MKKKCLLCVVILALMLFAAACGTVSTENAAAYTDNIAEVEVPEGKPQPTDGEEQTVDKSKSGTCTLLVECSTILDNMESLNASKTALVPSDGVIYAEREVTFYEGETVFDVLQREMINEKIHFEFTNNPVYNSAYVEGIGNLYEFDCGSLSGWTYSVNGWFPNYGCSRYLVSEGDCIAWRYTCDLGKDVGSDGMQE